MTARVATDFWKGRRVLLTGHTGFKGSWAALWLSAMGARVYGFARAPLPGPSLYESAGVSADVVGTIGDLLDAAALRACVDRARPEIVLHLASQALVRKAFCNPVDTFASNVNGTANLLDVLRHQDGLHTILVVTTDKVYYNDNQGRAFREDDPLWGEEPYAASKVAQELVVSAYAHSYFAPAGIKLATARGGNVIGGGDFAADRLVPDIVRAVQCGVPVCIRHPRSTRPWQHVLDCLAGYLVYTQQLVTQQAIPSTLNIGPSATDSLPVSDVCERMCRALGSSTAWVVDGEAGPIEAKTLALDVALSREVLGWIDVMPASAAIDATAHWYAAYLRGEDMRAICQAEIDVFMRRPATGS